MSITKQFTLILLLSFVGPVLKAHPFKQEKEKVFSRDGLSFSLPENWKLVSNDSIGYQAYYVSAERSGKGSSGLITVTWFNREEDPVQTIQRHQKTMREANIYRNPGIEFTDIIPLAIGEYPAHRCNYQTIVKGEKLDGQLICLNAYHKTITLFFQSAQSDKKINQKAFDLLSGTFNCRNTTTVNKN